MLSPSLEGKTVLLLMLERDMPIDAVLWADTGMEFPEMYRHLQKLDDLLFRERGIHITTEPFPKKRTQKVKKKRNDSWCIRTGGQAAEQRRPASKRAGEIQPRAE